MSSPKLSQTALYEILVSEVESLKTTKRDYEKTLSKIGEHLNRLEALYKEPISVDTKSMQEEHLRIKTTLSRGLYIPNWLWISFVSLFVVLCLSVCWNYRQYVINKLYSNHIERAEAHIEELEKKK
jgi:hypothetical protein